MVISVVIVDTVVARKIHGVNSWICVNIGPEDYLLAFMHTHNAHPQGGGYHEEDRTEQQIHVFLFLFHCYIEKQIHLISCNMKLRPISARVLLPQTDKLNPRFLRVWRLPLTHFM